MRKRTVNHVADTIFWYVLYFLPILSYLLFCFTEPVKAIENTNTPVETNYNYSAVIEDNLSYTLDITDNFIPAGTYIFNDVLDFTGLPGAYSSCPISFMCNDIYYSNMVLSPNVVPREFYYGSTNATDLMVYVVSSGWSSTDYQVITILSDFSYIDIDFDWVLFLKNNLTTYELPPLEPNNPSTGVVSFYDYVVSTYTFLEDNFIYNTLNSVVGLNGVVPLLADKGILLFFSWFIGVYITHLLVDFLLFIPRLCHKWLKIFTERD